MTAVHLRLARRDISAFVFGAKSSIIAARISRSATNPASKVHIATAALVRAQRAFAELRQEPATSSLRVVHATRLKNDLRDCRRALKELAADLEGKTSQRAQEMSRKVIHLRQIERAFYRRLRKEAPTVFERPWVTAPCEAAIQAPCTQLRIELPKSENSIDIPLQTESSRNLDSGTAAPIEVLPSRKSTCSWLSRARHAVRRYASLALITLFGMTANRATGPSEHAQEVKKDLAPPILSMRPAHPLAPQASNLDHSGTSVVNVEIVQQSKAAEQAVAGESTPTGPASYDTNSTVSLLPTDTVSCTNIITTRAEESLPPVDSFTAEQIAATTDYQNDRGSAYLGISDRNRLEFGGSLHLGKVSAQSIFNFDGSGSQQAYFGVAYRSVDDSLQRWRLDAGAVYRATDRERVSSFAMGQYSFSTAVHQELSLKGYGILSYLPYSLWDREAEVTLDDNVLAAKAAVTLSTTPRFSSNRRMITWEELATEAEATTEDGVALSKLNASRLYKLNLVANPVARLSENGAPFAFDIVGKLGIGAGFDTERHPQQEYTPGIQLDPALSIRLGKFMAEVEAESFYGIDGTVSARVTSEVEYIASSRIIFQLQYSRGYNVGKEPSLTSPSLLFRPSEGVFASFNYKF